MIRTDRLGDVILTLPACAALRRDLPGVWVAMMVRRYVGPVVAGNRLVDEVLWYDDTSGRPRALRDLVSELRSKKFDAAIAARPTPRIAWMLARAGIPVRVGTGYRYYSALFTDRVFEHRKTAERHELEYNLQLLEPLGIRASMRPWPAEFGIVPAAGARISIQRILRSFGISPGADLVVMHPGSGGSAREWPPERFRELALNLCEMKNVAVIITGTPAEERTLRRMLYGMRPGVLSLAGKLRMDQLAALLAQSALFISNSTGPLHLASALGTPVIGLYPPITAMSARRWGPYGGQATVIEGEGPAGCRRCGRGTACTCMLTIGTEQVTGEAMRILGQVRHERGSIVA